MLPKELDEEMPAFICEFHLVVELLLTDESADYIKTDHYIGDKLNKINIKIPAFNRRFLFCIYQNSVVQ